MPLSRKEMRQPSSMGFAEKLKMLFLHPGQFFDRVRDEDLKPAFVMFVLFFLISMVISGVVNYIFYSKMIVDISQLFGITIDPSILFILSIPANIVVGIIVSIIVFLWVHLFVRLLGGKNGLEATLKALMYVSVPVTLIGLILAAIMGGSINLFDPYGSIVTIGIISIISLVILVWAIYLNSLAIGKLHNISIERGFAALIVAVIVGIVIIIISGIIAALILFGEVNNEFNPPTYKVCTGFSYFIYYDHKLSAGTGITKDFSIKLKNINKPISISSITLTPGTDGTLIPVNPTAAAGQIFIANLTGVAGISGKRGDSYSIDIQITYDLIGDNQGKIDQGTCTGRIE